MELGNKLKQARLEAGLSQRQLCGDVITRNMLSQIENGTARPSMDTLRILAARLGKSVSYFLDETAVTSPNQKVMEQARAAWEQGGSAQVMEVLKNYRAPDPVFDSEAQLLKVLAALQLAQDALHREQFLHAEELLVRLGQVESGYCAALLERHRLLLLAQAQPRKRQEICAALPSLDAELLLRAWDALDRGVFDRAEHLAEAAQCKDTDQWQFLRGEIHMAQKQYAQAAACYHRVEESLPERAVPRLERCYRELEDYKRAYYYACLQK